MKNRLIFLLLVTMMTCVPGGYGKTIKQAQSTSSDTAEQSQHLDQEARKNILMLVGLMMMDDDKESVEQLKAMQQTIPKVLTVVKKYRDCLQHINNSTEAKACQQKGRSEAQKMGLNSEELGELLNDDLSDWPISSKQVYLQGIDKSLQQWKKALPCILNAETPQQVAECLGIGEWNEKTDG